MGAWDPRIQIKQNNLTNFAKKAIGIQESKQNRNRIV